MPSGFMWLVVLGITGIALGTLPVAQEVLLDNEYRGACGLTDEQIFQASKPTYISSIRVWYNTQYSGESLSVRLFSPDNEFYLETYTQIGGCDPYQTQWCEGWVDVYETLPVGEYYLVTETQLMCEDPNGHTTLVIYGDAGAQPSHQSTQSAQPPSQPKQPNNDQPSSNYVAVAGAWIGGAGWGKTELEVNESGVSGRYEYGGNGQLYGQMIDNHTFSGYWSSNGSSQTCESADRTGRKHWGKVIITFNQDFSKFTDTWGYCNEEPSRQGNGGHR